MANAPSPGAAKKRKASRTYARVTVQVDGVPVVAEVRPQDYGAKDELIVRMATKRPLNEAFPEKGGLGYELSLQGCLSQLRDHSTVGLDSLAVIWWYGRRKAGEQVTLGHAFFNEFPSLADAMNGDVEVEEIDPDEEDSDLPDLTPEG